MRAEASLRAYLEWGSRSPDRFEPREEDYVRLYVAGGVADLPVFTRYYMGVAGADGARQILIIGAAGSHAWRDRMWLRGVPRVIDGACSYWWFFVDAATERPIRFTCNGNP